MKLKAKFLYFKPLFMQLKKSNISLLLVPLHTKFKEFKY